PAVIIPGCSARERIDVSAIAYDREVGIGLSLRRGGERRDTLPQREVSRLRRLRAEAESARLFYVAATRARDTLRSLGEGGRRKGTWREHLDRLLLPPAGHVLRSSEPPPLPPAEVPGEASAVADPPAQQEAAQRLVSRALD